MPSDPVSALPDDEPYSRSVSSSSLSDVVVQLSRRWSLTLGGSVSRGTASWVVPAVLGDGTQLVLKVARQHSEADHEADGLRIWDGNGAVHLYDSVVWDHMVCLLIERCVPGTPLSAVEESVQDEVVTQILRRIWIEPPSGHPFRPLQDMCDQWVDEQERRVESAPAPTDAGILSEGREMFRTLARTAERNVLLSTDLHAGNVLAARREPWLLIDPKPYIGDPSYDVVQHLLNCEERLLSNPRSLATRIADLAELDVERVLLWLFARCVLESSNNPTLLDVAHRLRPA